MKQYTKTQLCERYEINKTTQGQTIQATPRTSQASAAALARFSLGARLDTHISQQPEEPNPDQNPLPLPETYEQLDQFIDQCIYEWAQWLLTTELRHSQLQYKHRRPYHLIDWSKLPPMTAPQNKEATTTS